eukprot:Phypoly_transcript_08694.p1 GENE.Phypoly_transcript_08694~~Phypoly_transcript_08694.p1  ORF type:complete len:416 (+),score=39.27 Phypoly_transcript_08694:111-1358(+)
MRITYICLCLLALVASAFSQCAQDFECGNHPYAVCHGGVNECRNTLPGLGVDEATNELYFAQICRTHSKLNNITFKKVSANGDVPVVIATQQQVPEAVNPDELFDIVGDNLYFSTESKTPGHLLATLSLSTLTQSGTIDTGAYFQGAIEFDVANKKTYVCNLDMSDATGAYTIDRFDGILGQDANPTRSTLYTLPLTESCTAVRALGSDVYFSVTDVSEGNTHAVSRIYKGNGTCANCATAPELLFSLNRKKVTDFDVTSDRIFYGTTTGVYSSDYTGKKVAHISWSNGASGVRVLGNRVYWNSGVAIISANLESSGVRQVNTFSGTCGCRPGFSSDSCSACAGGQVQWLEGVPSCVTISNTDGNPATCNYDYECSNAPYAHCDGTCKCRAGFSGAQCNVCAGTVSWKAGVPTCQ